MSLPVYIETHRTDPVLRHATLLKLDTSTPQYLTDADLPVVYGGNTYVPTRSLVVSNVVWSSDGTDFVTANVEIGNGDAAFGVIVSGFTGASRAPGITLYSAWFDLGQNVTVQAAWTLISGRCDAPTWDSEKVTFRIVPPADGTAEKLPWRTFGTSCTHRKFKGGPCGYAGAATSCDRSFASCTTLGNTARFGGFRYLPAEGQRFQLNSSTAITLTRRTT